MNIGTYYFAGSSILLAAIYREIGIEIEIEIKTETETETEIYCRF